MVISEAEDYLLGRATGAEEVIAAAAPWIRALIKQDAGFRLASVLSSVREQKQEKLNSLARLQSVLNSVSDFKETIESLAQREALDWGSW